MPNGELQVGGGAAGMAPRALPNEWQDIANERGPLEPYRPEDIAKFTMGSFRTSQGDFGTQYAAVNYVLATHGDRITYDAIAVGMGLALVWARKFADQGASHSEGKGKDAVSEIDRTEGWWRSGLANRQGLIEQLPGTVEKILEGTLRRDRMYLIDGEGRKRMGVVEDGHVRPSSKYLSNIAYYGLSAHSTGMEEYDQMWRDVTAALYEHKDDPMQFITIKGIEDTTVGNTAQDIVAAYLSHYPDELESIPEEWRPAAGPEG